MKKYTKTVLFLLLVSSMLLFAGCGNSDDNTDSTTVEPIDPLAQFTDVREYFLARLITTNYEGRYETLINETAEASGMEEVEAAYAKYTAGFEDITTEYLYELMQEAHDPYKYDEREYEQGRSLSATDFDFTVVSEANNVINYEFVIYVTVSSEAGEQTGTITGEMTVRETEEGTKIGNYFFSDWLLDLSALPDPTDTSDTTDAQ